MSPLSLPILALCGAAQIAPVKLPEEATEHYFVVARLIMRIAHSILDFFHQGSNASLFIIVYAVMVFLISFGIGLLLQWLIVKLCRRLSRRWKGDIYSNLLDEKFFTRTLRIIPAIIFLIFIQFTLFAHVGLSEWLTRLTWVYIIVTLALSLCILANVTWIHVDNRDNKRKLPLKGLVSLAKGIIWILATIVIVALLVNKSPASLLAGVGAFAAVLMLVFKDSILGVVAGVQLSENDSLHVGDWIAAGDANGVVTEVTLTQVKVLNWNKTTTTLPPYSLVSNGFTNYRSMQTSNTRQVQRSYMIDADSVIEATDDLLDELAKIPLLTDWIAKKRAQKAAGNVQNANNSEGLVDGTIETNLGVFRAYLTLYLQNSKDVYVNTDDGFSYMFVTTLPQTSAGIPLQLYFFTSTSHWVAYESIMAAVFEHIAVMLSKFKLYTFEYPTGRDTILEGIMSQGKSPDAVFGLPEGVISNPSSTPSTPQ